MLPSAGASTRPRRELDRVPGGPWSPMPSSSRRGAGSGVDANLCRRYRGDVRGPCQDVVRQPRRFRGARRPSAGERDDPGIPSIEAARVGTAAHRTAKRDAIDAPRLAIARSSWRAADIPDRRSRHAGLLRPLQIQRGPGPTARRRTFPQGAGDAAVPSSADDRNRMTPRCRRYLCPMDPPALSRQMD
jgi:hypothetical protein